jgi:hypothetical protein
MAKPTDTKNTSVTDSETISAADVGTINMGGMPKVNATEAEVAKMNAGEELPDFSSWSPLQIGFAPYWHPEVGRSFFGKLIARDDRDPAFVRFLVQSLRTEKCHRGPRLGEDGQPAGEDVIVSKGETFSISVYHSLAEEFNFHLFYGERTGEGVPVYVTAKKKTKTQKEGRTVWNWEVKCEPSVKAQLQGHRADYRTFLTTGEAPAERPQLDAE